MTREVAEGFDEDVGGGDCVLNGEVDADAADGRHGVRGVADAEEAGEVPAVEDVDLDREELDLVPGGDLGDAVGEERRDADDARWKASRPAGLTRVSKVSLAMMTAVW